MTKPSPTLSKNTTKFNKLARLSIQMKIIRPAVVEENMTSSYKRNQLTETDSEMQDMMELAEKNVK